MTAPKFVPRPDHVFVGAKVYQISWYTEAEWGEQHLSESDAGLTYCSSNNIYMRLLPGATEANYQEVLLHEITHAVWAETHLEHLELTSMAEDKIEEAIIGIQSHGLLFVLKHNPAVMSYLMSDGNVRR